MRAHQGETIFLSAYVSSPVWIEERIAERHLLGRIRPLANGVLKGLTPGWMGCTPLLVVPPLHQNSCCWRCC